MQTVHLGRTAPSPAAPGAWQTAQALAGLIASAGEPGFDQTAIACLNTALPLCWWSVYSVHALRAPTLHLGGSYRATDHTHEAFRFYADGPWRHDPTFDAARERLAQGEMALTHWHASEIPKRQRSGIYTRHALRERVSLVTLRAGGSLTAINLYRHDAQPAFADTELDLLSLLAPPLLACVDRHLRSLAAAPVTALAGPLDALPRREREVCERLLRGWTHEGVARDLGISAGTVKTYRDRAFERLEIHHRNELFALVLRSTASGGGGSTKSYQ